MQIDKAAKGLANDGWAIVPQAIAPELLQSTRSRLLCLKEENQLLPARVGRGSKLTSNPQIRGDWIYWLDDAVTQPFTIEEWIEGLRCQLNESLFLGLREFEGHLACYPPGTGYQRHWDQHQQGSRRVVSCVIYLNELWDESWGGQLRLFDRTDSGITRAEVVPHGGTVVLFMSAEVPHEVLPSLKERLSVAAWLLEAATP
jgi:SM-20-related protein